MSAFAASFPMAAIESLTKNMPQLSRFILALVGRTESVVGLREVRLAGNHCQIRLYRKNQPPLGPIRLLHLAACRQGLNLWIVQSYLTSSGNRVTKFVSR